MSPSARRAKQPPPRGAEAVRRALLDAGADLFAGHGPARVSVRDVARRARVNHGLVHRHFGSKDGLVRAVLDDLSARVLEVADLPAPDDASAPTEKDLDGLLRASFAAITREPRYFRLLARTLLDGPGRGRMQTSFPLIRRLVDAASAAQRRGLIASEVDPRTLVAASAALGLGWLLFEPYLLAATDQAHIAPEAARRRLLQTCSRTLSPAAALPRQAVRRRAPRRR